MLARHSTITLTMDHYTHLGIGDSAAELRRLRAVRSGKGETCGGPFRDAEYHIQTRLSASRRVATDRHPVPDLPVLPIFACAAFAFRPVFPPSGAIASRLGQALMSDLGSDQQMATLGEGLSSGLRLPDAATALSAGSCCYRRESQTREFQSSRDAVLFGPQAAITDGCSQEPVVPPLRPCRVLTMRVKHDTLRKDHAARSNNAPIIQRTAAQQFPALGCSLVLGLATQGLRRAPRDEREGRNACW